MSLFRITEMILRVISKGFKQEENRMRTGLYKGLSNEELVKLYKAGDTGAFDELMKKTEALRSSLAQRYLNIPGSEFEDLMSEGAMVS